MTPVCTGCGVVAPAKRAECECCERALPRPRVFAPAEGDLFFAAVRSTATCRACDFPSPIDGIVTTESIDCGQCGSLQRFDRSVWSDALALAHAVGDLGGPNPEGRRADPVLWIGDHNPHRSLGLSDTFARNEGERFVCEASPGWPVCRSCSVLLQCEAVGGVVSTRCPRCGSQARYAVPHGLEPAVPSVMGVVSELHRVDQLEVRVQSTASGLQALLCPRCGATVQAGGGNAVQCSYCGTIAAIPPRARLREKGSIVKPTIFWVAFCGPSAKRASLTRPAPAPSVSRGLVGLLGRGLSPLPGIELAPRRPGLDVRQLLFTLGTTAFATGVSYGVYRWLWGG